MNNTQALVLSLLRDYFPDWVDVVEVSENKTVTEYREFTDSEESIIWSVQENKIELKELEPEVGIFAGMSSLTHRVYVYFSIDAACI